MVSDVLYSFNQLRNLSVQSAHSVGLVRYVDTNSVKLKQKRLSVPFVVTVVHGTVSEIAGLINTINTNGRFLPDVLPLITLWQSGDEQEVRMTAGRGQSMMLLRNELSLGIRWRWRSHYEKLLSICIAMARLDLPAYVLLWIVDFLPFFSVATTELRKIRLIEGVHNSVRRIDAVRMILLNHIG
jgi:hypothetical protein